MIIKKMEECNTSQTHNLFSAVNLIPSRTSYLRSGRSRNCLAYTEGYLTADDRVIVNRGIPAGMGAKLYRRLQFSHRDGDRISGNNAVHFSISAIMAKL